jgi:outer membrane lipase/esterase
VVPDLPFSFGSAADQQARLLYSQTLWSSLAASGVSFIPADQNAMRLAIASNPALFGFQFIDTAHPACTQPAGVNSAWALLCSSNPAAPSHLVAPNADQTRLFADDQHLTTAGQLILADYEYSLIVAPSEISFLAEIPVKVREAMVDSIFDQIAISQRQRRAGTFNVWVGGDVASLAMNANAPGFPSDPGTPAAVTAGIDYAIAPGLIVGAAFSYGQTTQSWSLGGSFTEKDIAGSLYGAFNVGPYWGSVVGSYGGLNYDTNRIVPIGITTISNTSNTNGSNASLGIELGYNFTSRVAGWWNATPSFIPEKGPLPTAGLTITSGPVAGILLQQVYVDGFTESDPFSGDASGGFTALSFLGQVRNSAVSELGYQASTDIGIWHPYAKLAWDHELVPHNRLVTASLTTIAAPSFSMPAVVLGSDWGTGTIGTTVALGHGITGYASFTSQIAQNQATVYGGLIGVSVALNGAPAPLAAK